MQALMTLSPTVLQPLASKLGGVLGLSLSPATVAGAVGATLFGVVASSALTGHNTFEQLFFVDLTAHIVSKDIETRWAEHDIPNREGAVFQFMGTKPAVINISGKWIYENKPASAIYKILFPLFIGNARIGWNWFQATMFEVLQRLGIPLFFSYDLFSGPVIIKKQNFTQDANEGPGVYNYQMILKEWNPAMSLIGTTAILSEQTLGGLIGAPVNRGF